MIAGFDTSTYAIAVALLSDDGDDWSTLTLRLRKASDSGETAGLLALRELEPLLVASDVPWGDVTAAWIERGFGASRRSDFALGATVGALLAVLPCIGDAAVNPIGLGEWRKALTGNGNASKEMIRRELTRLGFACTTLSEDEADALGIAWAGRALALHAAERASRVLN